MRIGVAGLGRMGAALAARLIEQGHVVTVWNQTPEKAAGVVAKGAALAPTPAALTQRSEMVISILTDAEAIASVYDGPAGLLAGNPAGRLFIEMGTVRSASQVALADRVAATGADFIECPVGGTRGEAARPRGRRGGGGGACAAGARTALPPRRTCRADRRGREHETRDQPPARGILAGPG